MKTKIKRQSDYLIFSLKHKAEFCRVIWVKFCSLIRKTLLKYHIRTTKHFSTATGDVCATKQATEYPVA